MSGLERISLGPNSPLRQYLRTERDEDAETALCDDRVARISGKDDGAGLQGQFGSATGIHLYFSGR